MHSSVDQKTKSFEKQQATTATNLNQPNKISYKHHSVDRREHTKESRRDKRKTSISMHLADLTVVSGKKMDGILTMQDMKRKYKRNKLFSSFKEENSKTILIRKVEELELEFISFCHEEKYEEAG